MSRENLSLVTLAVFGCLTLLLTQMSEGQVMQARSTPELYFDNWGAGWGDLGRGSGSLL